ncbi:MAG: penicillin acylase family protein [Bacteroidota bacterium]
MKNLKDTFCIFLTVFITTALHVRIGVIPPLARFLDPFHGFWQNATVTVSSYPPVLAVSGLQDTVTIHWDKHQIPHIQAHNDADLYWAQGYATASHRLWQMEFQAQVAAGRVSEIFGARTLDFDRLQRRKGLVYGAQHVLSTLAEDNICWDIIQAYTAGINAYICTLAYKDLPVEYKLLNYKPEPWTPLKTALLFVQVADQLNGYDESLRNTYALHHLGEAHFHFLYPAHTPGLEPVIPPHTPWSFHPVPIPKPPAKVAASLMPQGQSDPTQPMHPAPGSNNWAVSATKTRTGVAYLANDPHLGLHIPAIWYAVQLQSPSVHVAGVTIPGIPGVLIGFNKNIAWGVTNAAWQVRDWYLMDFKDETRRAYYYDGKLLASQFRVEEIQVRGRTPFCDTVVYTHLGPIVYDENFSRAGQPHNLAMQWTGHHAGHELKAFYLINRAKNWADFEHALQYYQVPAHNFAFASTQGDIAMEIAGKFPIRWPQQGRFVMPGDASIYDWAGFIPRDHQPSIVNPMQGYVSSANERATDRTYPYHYAHHYEEYYRNRRIRHVLRSAQQVTEKTMMQLQHDNYNLPAQENLARWLRCLDTTQLDPQQQSAYQALVTWNLQNTVDQTAPSIFAAWQAALEKRLWGHLREKGMPKPSLYATLYLLQHHAESPYLAIGMTEQDLIREAFTEAVNTLASWEVQHHKPYQWGDYRKLSIEHLARISTFGLHQLRAGGGEHIVNANSGNYGASMRLVVALGKVPRGWLIYPGGQTGNPGSPHYTQFVEAWCTGEYIPLTLDDSSVQPVEGCTQLLRPQS